MINNHGNEMIFYADNDIFTGNQKAGRRCAQNAATGQMQKKLITN